MRLGLTNNANYANKGIIMKKALSIRNFPVKLHAGLKAKAAHMQIPLRELIINSLMESLGYKKIEGK